MCSSCTRVPVSIYLNISLHSDIFSLTLDQALIYPLGYKFDFWLKQNEQQKIYINFSFSLITHLLSRPFWYDLPQFIDIYLDIFQLWYKILRCRVMKNDLNEWERKLSQLGIWGWPGRMVCKGFYYWLPSWFNNIGQWYLNISFLSLCLFFCF